MDTADELINLLNGLGKQEVSKRANGRDKSMSLSIESCREKSYLDMNGAPTDRFLQALKNDFTSSSKSNGRQKADQLMMSPRQSKRDTSNSKLSAHNRYMSGDLSGGEGEDDNSSGSSSNRSHSRKSNRASILNKTSNNSRNYSSNNIDNHKAKETKKDRESKERKSNEKMQIKRKEKERNNNKDSSSMNNSHMPSSSINNHAKSITSKMNSYDSSKNKLQYPNSYIDDDESDLKIDADMRVKSLKLRLTGQLSTIHVLEQQLVGNIFTYVCINLQFMC